MSHSPEQSQIIDFLNNPETYGLPPDTDVEHVQTHASHVFLAGARAVKMKKAVKYPYLDFSTLDKRIEAASRELEVNQHFSAANLYEGLGGIVENNGDLNLIFSLNNENQQDLIEPLVIMQRFDHDNQLDRIAERGGLNSTIAIQLGVMAARAIQQAETRDIDWPAEFRNVVDDSLKELRRYASVFDDNAIASLSERWEAWLVRYDRALHDRVSRDRIRRCHGDLHLRNIAIIDGDPTPFDALEFDERLATTDVLYDLAFLAMDLMRLNLAGAAARTVTVALSLIDDFAGAGLLPGYIGARAMVRAKVIASQIDQSDDADQQKFKIDAHAYLRLASEVFCTSQPAVIAVAGLSGAGKSTLAFALAKKLGPHAVVIGSDIVRKSLAGIDLLDRGPEDIYTAAWNRRTYKTLVANARSALQSGASVILDATFASSEDREIPVQLARGFDAPFTGLWLELDAKERVNRVHLRKNDVSDAGETVARSQAARRPDRNAWNIIDARENFEEIVTQSIRAIKLSRNRKHLPKH